MTTQTIQGTADLAEPSPAPQGAARRLLPVLGGLIALGPLSVDMYLPALPAIQSSLGASPAAVQLTITGIMAGMAVGQLVVGPLADAIGRRRPLIAGLVLYAIASLLCAAAPDLLVLGLARILQGLAVSTAGVTATAMMRDLFEGRALARVLSRLLIIPLAAPVIAPTIGGLLLWAAPWRGVFVLLAIFGVAMLISSVLMVRETLPVDRRQPANPASMARTFSLLVTDRRFVALALMAGAGMAALLGYVGGAPFVFQQGFGIDQQQFAIIFGAGGVSLIMASQLNAYLLRHHAPERILGFALVIGTLAVAGLVVAAHTGIAGVPGLLVALWAMLAAIGMVFPNAPAVAMSRHGENAGSAAALIGAAQFGIGAVAAPAVGLLGNTAMAMAAVSTVAMITAAIALLATRVRRGAQHAAPGRLQ